MALKSCRGWAISPDSRRSTSLDQAWDKDFARSILERIVEYAGG
ncbi:MAG: hypothetical protein ACE5JR_13840 [Gemmatimonadota bacterium]